MDIYGLFNEEGALVHEIDNDDSWEKLIGGRKGTKFPVQWILDNGYIPYIKPLTAEHEKISGVVVKGNSSYTKKVIPYSAEELEAFEAAHIRDISNAIQDFMDMAAQEKGYDNIVNACGYAAAPNPFQSESLSFVAWRGNVWAHAYKVLADVKAGARTEPTIEELIAELPKLDIV